MANINTPKGFEKQLLQPDIISKLDPFIEYVNQNFDQLIRAFFNQITLGENFRGKFISISAKHNTPITLDVLQGISAVWPYRVADGSLKSFILSTDNRGRPTVTFFFDDALPITTRSIVFASPFCTAETNSSVRVGDRIEITGAVIDANKGTFLVVEMLENPTRVVYRNIAGVTETNTIFRGDQESAKAIDLFVFFS